MMDISDGLATDLAHLCDESGVGAEIQQDQLPVSRFLKNAATELGADVFDFLQPGLQMNRNCSGWSLKSPAGRFPVLAGLPRNRAYFYVMKMNGGR